jgi:hypothetical protein
MTRGPDGGATAQALNAKADVIPIVKRACDIVVILSPGLCSVATARLPLSPEEFLIII